MNPEPAPQNTPAGPSLPHPPSATVRCCSGAWFAWAAMVLVLYVLDQVTKLWTAGWDSGRPGWPVIPQRLPLGEHLPVWPDVFHWVHFSNTGAAFGIMQDSNRFFIGLSLSAMAGIYWCLKRTLFPGLLNHVALLLLLSGILGNLTDRLLHGYVVDFLLFDFGFWPFHPWPAFNVADSCICVAVGLLMIASVRDSREQARAAAQSSPEGPDLPASKS